MIRAILKHTTNVKLLLKLANQIYKYNIISSFNILKNNTFQYPGLCV
jgi:hypothetical protein